MGFSVPKARFVDHAHYYVPQMTWLSTNSPSESLCSPKEGKTEAQKRKYCIKHLIANILLSPFQVTGVAAYSAASSLKNVGSLVITTGKLPWKFSENKAYWTRTFFKITDKTISAVTSPLHPIISCARLIAGIIRPESYFKSEPILLEDRLQIVNSKHHFKAYQVPPEKNPPVIANCAFISSLYNYSYRWGLIRASEGPGESIFGQHSKGYFKTKKFLSRQRKDKVVEKYELLKAFHDLLGQPEKFENNKEIVKFLNENFKTPRQKAVLKTFLGKKPKTFIDRSGIPYIQKLAKIGPNDQIYYPPNPLRDSVMGEVEVLLKEIR